MTEDLILWFVVLGIGFLIGYNWTPKENKKQELICTLFQKLQEEKWIKTFDHLDIVDWIDWGACMPAFASYYYYLFDIHIFITYFIYL